MPELGELQQMQQDKSQNEVEESEQLLSIVQKVGLKRGQNANQHSAIFKQILERYREQPQLLDPLLEDLLTPLNSILQDRFVLRYQGSLVGTCRIIFVVIQVRGRNVVSKLLPNKPNDLEHAIKLFFWLLNDAQKCNDQIIEVEEAQCTVLLWLSVLVLVPFSLDTLVTKSDKSVSDTLIERCKGLLKQAGAVREMAGILVSRLLTRPDNLEATWRSFLDWCICILQQQKKSAYKDLNDLFEEMFALPGVMFTLAHIFKVGHRDRLQQWAKYIWQHIVSISDQDWVAPSIDTLARKYAVKVTTRLGLVLLDPRAQRWRYQPQRTQLLQSLDNTVPIDSNTILQQQEEEDAEDSSSIPQQYVEELMGCLLVGLKDADTVVRWCAAKGVGRILERLPEQQVNQRVEQLLQMFHKYDSDTTWHGGCLALAELTRRGLLLPQHLPQSIQIVTKSLKFDLCKGNYSVGSHVRDAGAYVCWAFARSYDPQKLSGHVTNLAPELMTLACYDREVNCRRAAAAAFQECVGRLGNFPHGIEILTAADYFTLSNRQQAYLHVAPYVAQFPGYFLALALHLLNNKIFHWEKAIRVLAAQGLHKLTHLQPQWFLENAVAQLVKQSIDNDLTTRHGACHALGRILLALSQYPAFQQLYTVPATPQTQQIIKVLLKLKDLSHGKGSELTRDGRCSLFAHVSMAAVYMEEEEVEQVLQIVEDDLCHPSEKIQKKAANAFGKLARQYCTGNLNLWTERLVLKLIPKLHDNNILSRRGHALAIGQLPVQLLNHNLSGIIQSVCNTCKIEQNKELRDVESRVNAICSLGQIISKTFFQDVISDDNEHCDIENFQGCNEEQHLDDADDNVCVPCKQQIGVEVKLLNSESYDIIVISVLGTLLECMEDYSLDNRGDVGSWVREASMREMTKIVVALSKDGLPDKKDFGDVVQRVVCQLMKQGVERIGRVREASVGCMRVLLDVNPKLGISEQDEVRIRLFGSKYEGQSSIQSQYSEIFDRADRLPDLVDFVFQPVYSLYVLEGLVMSMGGIDEGLSQAVTKSLLSSIYSQYSFLPASGWRYSSNSVAAKFEFISQQFLKVWKQNQKSWRLGFSLLKSADVLFSCRKFWRFVGNDFCGEVLELVKSEIRGCGDLQRICLAISILGHLLCCQVDTVFKGSLQAMMVLLASKFPKVRRHTAEEIYLSLITPEILFLNPEQYEMTEQILVQSIWDGSQSEAREARDQLVVILGLEKPKKLQTSSAKPNIDVEYGKYDENASYQALIADVARGL